MLIFALVLHQLLSSYPGFYLGQIFSGLQPAMLNYTIEGGGKEGKREIRGKSLISPSCVFFY